MIRERMDFGWGENDWRRAACCVEIIQDVPDALCMPGAVSTVNI
jgi:hypothetical protein